MNFLRLRGRPSSLNISQITGENGDGNLTATISSPRGGIDSSEADLNEYNHGVFLSPVSSTATLDSDYDFSDSDSVFEYDSDAYNSTNDYSSQYDRIDSAIDSSLGPNISSGGYTRNKIVKSIAIEVDESIRWSLHQTDDRQRQKILICLFEDLISRLGGTAAAYGVANNSNDSNNNDANSSEQQTLSRRRTWNARSYSHINTTNYSSSINNNITTPCYYYELLAEYYEQNPHIGQKLQSVCTSLWASDHFQCIYALLIYRWLFSDNNLTVSRINVFLKGVNRLFWFDLENNKKVANSIYQFLKFVVLLEIIPQQLLKINANTMEGSSSSSSKSSSSQQSLFPQVGYGYNYYHPILTSQNIEDLISIVAKFYFHYLPECSSSSSSNTSGGAKNSDSEFIQANLTEYMRTLEFIYNPNTSFMLASPRPTTKPTTTTSQKQVPTPTTATATSSDKAIDQFTKSTAASYDKKDEERLSSSLRDVIVVSTTTKDLIASTSSNTAAVGPNNNEESKDEREEGKQQHSQSDHNANILNRNNNSTSSNDAAAAAANASSDVLSSSSSSGHRSTTTTTTITLHKIQLPSSIQDIFVRENILVLDNIQQNDDIKIVQIKNFKYFYGLDLDDRMIIRLQETLYAYTTPGGPHYASRQVRHVAHEVLDFLFPGGAYARKLINVGFRLMHQYSWPKSLMLWGVNKFILIVFVMPYRLIKKHILHRFGIDEYLPNFNVY